MADLITLTEQMSKRPISYNWARFSVDGTGTMTNFLLALQDVENKHIKKMLGRDLLKDMKDNPANYTEVLNGGTYDTDDGRTIPFEGLKFILAYLIAARYFVVGFKQDSFTGMVKKDMAEANQLSSAERKEEQMLLTNIALDEWEQLKIYLNKNAETYPLWVKYKAPTNTFKPTLSGVRKTFLR